LSEEQIRYAVSDTNYLMDLYATLNARLIEQGLDKYAIETFNKITSARWTDKTLNPEGYQKIKGCENLDVIQKARLKALFRWRFEKARETNTARFMILSDKNLLDLSREGITTISSLKEAGILSQQKVRTYGSDITAILSNFSFDM
jgi:ribonuclease D